MLNEEEAEECHIEREESGVGGAAQRYSICLACTRGGGAFQILHGRKKAERRRCVRACVLGYAAWTVVTPGEENVARVRAACSCACFDSLRCRAHSNAAMHMIKKGN